MNTLIIRKKSLKTWLHIDSELGDFIISKFYFNADNLDFQIVEQGNSKRVIYNVANITLYDDVNGGGAETFATITELSLRLEALNYPAFQYDGQIVSIANLIEEGTNITITGDGTELSPYVISATGGAGGGVETVTGTLVDDTDLLNPIINIPTLEQTTTAGNTTTNSMYSRADIATIDVAQENGVGFKDDYTGLRFIKDTKNVDIISDDVVTNYTIKLPNKSEASVQTMAMVEDVQNTSDYTNSFLLMGA